MRVNEVENNKIRQLGVQRRFPFWTAGVAIGVLFLAIGVYENQLTDIYRKAVMICLECIGIG